MPQPRPRWNMAARIWSNVGLAGIIGPATFLIVMTGLGFFREGYSPVREFGSELGASGTDLAWAMVLNFLFNGSLLMALGIGLFLTGGFTKGGKTAAVFVFLLGLGIFGSGIFQADSCCPREVSAEGALHDLVGLIALPSAIIAMFTYAKSLPKVEPWQRLRRSSLLWGVVSFVLLVATIASADPGLEDGFLGGLTGLLQRLFLVSIFTWTGTIGYTLYRVRREAATT